MTEVTQKDLMPGVRLTAVHTDKFKTCMLSATLLAPLDPDTAALNALVPHVLRRGTRTHPDMEHLSAALDELYGGAIEPMVRKKGENQCVGFVASFLDDAYAPGDTQILESAAALLGELLLRPAQENGGFRADYVDSERDNLVDRIRAQVNDKRSYSMLRLTQEMCKGEPYGVDKLGDEQHAASITPDALWRRYQELLGGAGVELYYCGSAPVERVEQALKTALKELPQTRRPAPVRGEDRAAPDREARLVTEAMDVTQGKLNLGFRTGGTDLWGAEYPALMVFNAVYGGTPTSKLFLNVREKLSLCYFANSMLEKFKGLVMVSSGIEFDKFDEAKAEILAQLDNCKAGRIDAQELEGGRRAVVSSLHTSMDSQARLEDFWLGQAVAGLTEGPEALADRVEAVTMDQVVAVANRLELDTIYFLKGQEG